MRCEKGCRVQLMRNHRRRIRSMKSSSTTSPRVPSITAGCGPTPRLTENSRSPPPESPGAHGLAMTAPYEHAIERTVPPIARKCDELELSIQYGSDAQFYVYANVTSRDGAKHESHWLNIRPGSSEPTQDPSYSKEFVVPVTAQLLGDGSMRLRLRLPLIVAACSGNKGWIFDSADRIRLRGCISVSPHQVLFKRRELKGRLRPAQMSKGRNVFAQTHSLGRSGSGSWPFH